MATSSTSSRTLQCMEIIGGNQAVQQALTSPGMDIWIDSRPLGGNAGGDMHYFSMCGSGRVTRLAVADVSGHGDEADQTARWLRTLMRKYINLLDQRRFARAVNQEFVARQETGRFATVLLLTYFEPTDHLVICNAGHPRPLWYSQRSSTWHILDPETKDLGPSIRTARARYHGQSVANLPLGVVDSTQYVQFSVNLAPGDIVLAYTDAFIEARNAQDQQLGEEGLLKLVRDIQPPPGDAAQPQEMARAVHSRLDHWRGGVPAEDDQTLIVLSHNGSGTRAWAYRNGCAPPSAY